MDGAAETGVILGVGLRTQGTLHAPALSVQTAAVTEAEVSSEQQRLTQEISTDRLPAQGHLLIQALLGRVNTGSLSVVQDQRVRAAAVERSLRVHADSSRTALLLTLVMVCALEQGLVEHVSAGAVAAEARDVVDTDSVLTDLRTETLTLVHVSIVEGSWSCGDVSSAVWTQSLELRCLWAWTGVVDAAPSPAPPLCAAALLKSRVRGEHTALTALQQVIITLPELTTASRGQRRDRGGVSGGGGASRR